MAGDLNLPRLVAEDVNLPCLVAEDVNLPVAEPLRPAIRFHDNRQLLTGDSPELSQVPLRSEQRTARPFYRSGRCESSGGGAFTSRDSIS